MALVCAAISSALLWWLYLSTRWQLKRLHARPMALALNFTAFACATVCIAGAALLRSPELGVVAIAFGAAGTFMGRRFVSWTGGPEAKWALANDYARILELLDSFEYTEGNVARVRELAAGLDRWRTPETAEFIDLAHEDIEQLMARAYEDRAVTDRRYARIRELIGELWEGRVPFG